MDILEMTFTAFKRDEFIEFLRGDGEYMIETSQYSPCAELTDVSKVLSRGIYKAYKLQSEILNEYEKSLMLMLDKTDFDVYMVCLYLISQLFKEKNDLSPFIMDKNTILKRLGEEIEKRKPYFKNGIIYPSGYKNTKVWEELERFNMVCKEEYQVLLF
jgi:hypothetical protein